MLTWELIAHMALHFIHLRFSGFGAVFIVSGGFTTGTSVDGMSVLDCSGISWRRQQNSLCSNCHAVSIRSHLKHLCFPSMVWVALTAVMSLVGCEATVAVVGGRRSSDEGVGRLKVETERASSAAPTMVVLVRKRILGCSGGFRGISKVGV